MNTSKLSSLTLIVLFFSTLVFSHNPDWGQTGHRTVGKIADGYLKGKAKKEISKILDGESLAFISTYADEIKSDKNYRKYSSWHYVNMPFGVKYEDAEKNANGDLVTGIAKCKEVLLDKNATKEEKQFHLKMLVHLIGDLHQPMHVGRKEDKGGNMVQVQWFGSGTNLHSVWDSKMINQFDMTYTELAENTKPLSKEQVKFLQQGTIEDWVNETQTYAIKAYNSCEVGENLRYEYMYHNFAMLRSQLQKGGIRLAKVLNELFA